MISNLGNASQSVRFASHMSRSNISIAIVGAGMGGLAVAATLRRIGADVHVYEQARQFARVGAGIQMLPNAMKVLRGIGIEERLRQIAFEPISHLNREWNTGTIMQERSEERRDG